MMPVSIVQWHTEICVFNASLNAKHLKLKSHISICFSRSCHLHVMSCMFLLLLICASNIELNPRDSFYSLLFCHWISTVLLAIVETDTVGSLQHETSLSKVYLDSTI